MEIMNSEDLDANAFFESPEQAWPSGTESVEEMPTSSAIPANSRLSFNLKDYVTDYNVSTKVVSSGGGVVVERAMYGAGRT